MASDDYFLEIEAHFAFRRQTPFILSAKDWVLMQRWRAEGIPLPIVIEAIDTVFEKNETSGRRKVISSLSYCRHAVKELWEERKDLYVGAGETTPETAIAETLEALRLEVDVSKLDPKIRARTEEANLRRRIREKFNLPRLTLFG